MAKFRAWSGVKLCLAVGHWLEMDRLRSKLRFEEMLDKLEAESSRGIPNKLLASVALRGDMISLRVLSIATLSRPRMDGSTIRIVKAGFLNPFAAGTKRSRSASTASGHLYSPRVFSHYGARGRNLRRFIDFFLKRDGRETSYCANTDGNRALSIILSGCGVPNDMCSSESNITVPTWELGLEETGCGTGTGDWPPTVTLRHRFH